ncbi:unnamed protein product [Sphagnum tenellum]
MSDETEDRTIFYVPDVNLNKFQAACAKLSRKAEKIGCSEIKPFIFGHTTQKLSDGYEHRVYEVLFTVDVPKIEGWTFIARIDHANETGNIIRVVPNTKVAVPERYRTSAPNCDHCNKIRRRRDTFVLHCEATDEFKIVGSSCLVDFFGHDPLKMARMAELLGYAWIFVIEHILIYATLTSSPQPPNLQNTHWIIEGRQPVQATVYIS